MIPEQSIFVVLGEIAFCYFLYTRVIKLYFKVWYYQRQGAVLCKGLYPIVGHLPRMAVIAGDNSIKEHPYMRVLSEDFPVDQPGAVILVNTFTPSLMISDPAMLQDIYGSKNRFFDKSTLSRDILAPLMGDTTIFQPTSDNWRQKRKSLSATFYKAKLLKMVDIVKSVVAEQMINWKKDYADTGKSFDVVSIISQLHCKVILSCIFGFDASEEMVPQTVNGKQVKVPVQQVLRTTFQELLMRLAHP
jgi:cytochrome P450